MTDTVSTALVEALETVIERSNAGEHVVLAAALRDIPIPVRAALAATALAAANLSINGVTMAAFGGYSRGTAAGRHKHALETVAQGIPLLVGVQLDGARTSRSVSEMDSELRKRDSTIAELRSELKQTRSELGTVLSYTRDLHNHLRDDLAQIEAERAKKVRLLRPLDDRPSADLPTDPRPV